ncbi:acyl-CoA dehydrogenase family protein [Pseudonocardia humida]|uniref:Acyl-CoA/acyl-ACP dehydrogenase n=1 Tax=Pseudonocardia humida TaxID=2800819 RepID=A0ABT0ZXN0_9PSEU|nr:acyl-CoA dehydrogenase family protein [Pseudonocardia humida]MCO1655500.1 acyl-CoA/acyl-ACP dehydrogenase [Pseudonocardia humida]
MDVGFDAAQRDLRRTVRDLLDREGGAGRGSPVWRRIRELGLLGITVGERHGGAGASSVELGIVLAELGRALTAVPFLQTTVAATVLDRSAAPVAAQVLPGLVAGDLVAGLATPGPASSLPVGTRSALTGVLDNVVDGPHLDLLLTPALVDGDTVLAAVRTDVAGVARTTLPTVDRSRPQARFVLDGAPAVVVGDAAAAARAVDLLLAAVAVESAGAARHCLDATVAHLRTREQFGRPLGTFQALQHRCADLAVLVESAWSTAWYATWAVDGDPATAAVSAPLAKAYCADAFRAVAGEMIQLHGGIGFTWEHPAHRYFKRATSTDLLFGGRAWVRSLVARRAGLRP